MLKMKIKLGTYLILPRAWYSLEKWRGGEKRRREERGEEEEGVEKEGRGRNGRRRGRRWEGRGGREREEKSRGGEGRGEGRRREEKGRGREYSLVEATMAPSLHMSCPIAVELGMSLLWFTGTHLFELHSWNQLMIARKLNGRNTNIVTSFFRHNGYIINAFLSQINLLLCVKRRRGEERRGEGRGGKNGRFMELDVTYTKSSTVQDAFHTFSLVVAGSL